MSEIFSIISFYRGFFDEEICGGYPADKYDSNSERYITQGTKDIFRLNKISSFIIQISNLFKVGKILAMVILEELLFVI